MQNKQDLKIKGIKKIHGIFWKKNLSQAKTKTKFKLLKGTVYPQAHTLDFCITSKSKLTFPN